VLQITMIRAGARRCGSSTVVARCVISTALVPRCRWVATLSIGHARLPLTPPACPHLVPTETTSEAPSPSTQSSLAWMLDKEALGQDVFISGAPGPERRRFVRLFASLVGREVEWLTISRDTTEADLKQRRELVGGGVVFHPQPPVSAALHGRLLVVEGVERAERNVLPTLNNLLENREMALEDGR
jgi:von Willebrand factor A domain-containing protein 8